MRVWVLWLLLHCALAVVACESGSGGSDTAVQEAFVVTYLGQAVKPDLAKAEDVTIAGERCKRLDSIALQAFPQVALDRVVVDFLAADGFKPAKSPNCTAIIPIPGTMLERGCIVLATHDLKWDPVLGWPGCMSLKGAVEMQIADR